jgi:hypothetical protein
MADDEVTEGIEADEVIDADVVEEDAHALHSAELAIREERENYPAPLSVLPSPREWEASLAVAEKIANTQFVPESYRGRPDSVLAAILTGREMGIGPMQSLRQIHMIDGRPAFAADLMMAKMRAGGVVVIESSSTAERAYIKAKRKDTGEEGVGEWTIKDAEIAGLLGKKNWKTYPGDMLWARAVGRLARRLGSDLLGGLVYAKEEMEDWGDDGGYGSGAPQPEKEFDPETDLAPTAPKTREEIAGQLNRFDPTVDWGEVALSVRLRQYGKVDLEGADLQDFYRRLANSVWFIDNATKDGDFPPVPPEILIAGFAYGFSGEEFPIVYLKIPPYSGGAALTPEQQAQAKAAPPDDVPFGTPSGEEGKG